MSQQKKWPKCLIKKKQLCTA